MNLVVLPWRTLAWHTKAVGCLVSRHYPTHMVTQLPVLSSEFLESDLVAIRTSLDDDTASTAPRLCAVRYDSTVAPLCRHEDDLETNLFLDPRCYADKFWDDVTDEYVTGRYGEGWYGQLPVPSLGGGRGYGAPADEVWSIDEAVLEQLIADGVELPILDVGIRHGEKSRGGSFI